MKKTWFITGASRGFGRIWAEAALKRGDKVTATARKLADIADLRERFGDAVREVIVVAKARDPGFEAVDNIGIGQGLDQLGRQ